MTVTTGSSPTLTEAQGRRAGRELALELVFRPLSNLLVPALVRIRIAPPLVVLANAVTGLLAAFVLFRGDLLAAALLLQLKTVLDNSDGALARVTGRVTLTGRYLDTVADLVVNAALFAALAHVTGRPVLAACAFVALVVVLAFDFNVSELYREARGIAAEQPAPSGSAVERVLEASYRALFAPLDRAVRALAARRGAAYDDVAVTVLANVGLSTQLLVLGICLAAGAPAVYLWFALACLAALVPLQLRAERRGRVED
jgi:phosphatidylglycerophosphate synthase